MSSEVKPLPVPPERRSSQRGEAEFQRHDSTYLRKSEILRNLEGRRLINDIFG